MQKSELLSTIPDYLKGKKDLSGKELTEFLLSFAFENESKEAANIIQQKIFNEGGFLYESPSELIDGELNENVSAFIKALFEFSKNFSELSSSKRHLYYRKAAGEFVQNYIGKNDNEGFYLICLSENNHVISTHKIADGDLGSVFIDVDSVVNKAKESKAKNVIIAHNHTSMFLKYSMEDYYSTEKIRAYLSAANITLLEHFVVNENGYRGIMKDLFGEDMWKPNISQLKLLN